MDGSPRLFYFLVSANVGSVETLEVCQTKLLSGSTDETVGGAAFEELLRVIKKIAPVETIGYHLGMTFSSQAEEKEFELHKSLLTIKYRAPEELSAPLRTLLSTAALCARQINERNYQMKLHIRFEAFGTDVLSRRVLGLRLRLLSLDCPASITPDQTTAFLLHDRTIQIHDSKKDAQLRLYKPLAVACGTPAEVARRILESAHLKWTEFRKHTDQINSEIFAVGEEEIQSPKAYEFDGVKFESREEFDAHVTQKVSAICDQLTPSVLGAIQQKLTRIPELYELRNVEGKWKKFAEILYGVHLLQIVHC